MKLLKRRQGSESRLPNTERVGFARWGFVPVSWWVILALCLAGCRAAAPVAPGGSPAPTTQAVVPTSTLAPPRVAVTAPAPARPTGSPAPSATLVLSAEPPRPSPAFTATPDPYAGLSVADLAARIYGGGQVEAVETLAVNGYFTRTLIRYPSDGLAVYGFMNVPKRGSPPYPVVIAIHGYIEPSIYATLDYTTRYADDLARAGFLVLHPNLRGYLPSDEGPNLFRVGMAVDVLNLIALVKAQAGQPGALYQADPQAIGLWGHSMGGGIATRVMVVSPDVRAVVLYGAMSGDEEKNFERINTYFSNGTRGLEELAVPAEVVARISPINFLERVQAAVSIHHGKADPDVPPAWSQDLCRRLQDLQKTVECFTYPGEGHTFHGEGDTLFVQRMIDFFQRELR